MPYIKEEDKKKLQDGKLIESAGELNYLFTNLIQEYIDDNQGLNYQVINDIVGALDGAKAEFQRRIVIPYEDKKIRENGDAYNDNILKQVE